MRKLLLALGGGLLAGTLHAQPITLTLKPGPAPGQDAMLWMLDGGCITSGSTTTPGNTNYGTQPEIPYADWTWNAVGCPGGTMRSLLRFDGLNAIPPNSMVVGASLRLFGVPTSASFPQGNTSFPGAPPGYLNNAGLLRRVTSPWVENTVTWNTQPAVTTAGEIPIPTSTAQWNWGTTITGAALAAMVQNMIGGAANNNGFQLRLATETHYRSTVFASSDHPNQQLWPELRVQYYRCSDFEYCYPSNNQFLYTFTALSPSIPGATYYWTINGNPAGTGPVITCDIRTVSPGTNPDTDPYTVCLRVVNASGAVICEKCNDICALKHQQTVPYNTASFKVCTSTSDPTMVHLSAINIATGTYTWYNYADGTGFPPTAIVPGTTYDLAPGIYPPSHTVVGLEHTLGSTLVASNFGFICLYSNPLREAPTGGEEINGTPSEGADLGMDRIGAPKLSVSPNPSHSGWSVTLDAAEESTVQIVLRDVTGKRISVQQQSLHKGSNNIFQPGDQLTPGIYLLEISSDRFRVLEKLVRE